MKFTFKKPDTKPEVEMLIGGLFLAVGPLIVKSSGLQAAPIGFYRTAIAILPLWAMSRFYRPKTQDHSALGFAFLAGLFFGLDLFFWHLSVFLSGAGLATLLTHTQVFFLGLLAFFFLSKKPSQRFWVSSAIAFGGLLLILQPEGNSEVGIAYGLFSGLAFSLYSFFMKRASMAGHAPTNFLVAIASISAALFTLGASLWTDSNLMMSGTQWTQMLVLSLLTQVIGWSLITKSIRLLPIEKVALLLMTQPLFAYLGGAIFFSEKWTPLSLLGSLLLLFSIGSAMREKVAR